MQGDLWLFELLICIKDQGEEIWNSALLPFLFSSSAALFCCLGIQGQRTQCKDPRHSQWSAGLLYCSRFALINLNSWPFPWESPEAWEGTAQQFHHVLRSKHLQVLRWQWNNQYNHQVQRSVPIKSSENECFKQIRNLYHAELCLFSLEKQVIPCNIFCFMLLHGCSSVLIREAVFRWVHLKKFFWSCMWFLFAFNSCCYVLVAWMWI